MKYCSYLSAIVVLLAVIVFMLYGCSAPPMKEVAKACRDAAGMIYGVAVDRDRGISRELQLATLPKMIYNNEILDVIRKMQYSIDIVYKNSELTPDQLRQRVLDNCTVDENNRINMPIEGL